MTRTWHRLDLGNGMLALGPTRRIQDAFMAVFMRAPASSGRAIFSRYDTHTDNVEVYFTPQATDIARMFNALPCEKPTLNEFRISLTAGDGNALALQFPEQSRHQG